MLSLNILYFSSLAYRYTKYYRIFPNSQRHNCPIMATENVITALQIEKMQKSKFHFVYKVRFQ